MIPKTKQCILCPYKKEEDCLYNHDKCYSLSNIYYSYIIKIFPFNIIHKIINEIEYYRMEKYYNKIEKEYGDVNKEDDKFKFIWGIKSYDDLCSAECGLMTMNDIGIVYNKKEKAYYLEIETAYGFDNYEAECDYLKNLLEVFTKYMDDNKLNKNKPFGLWMSSPCTDLKAKSIEELYTNFKIFVEGYCRLGKIK